jgi:hypothetical protein
LAHLSELPHLLAVAQFIRPQPILPVQAHAIWQQQQKWQQQQGDHAVFF